MHRIYLSLFAALLVLTGCEKDAQSIEDREERDPLVKSGQEYMDEGKWDEAIASFRKALDNEPLMARPNLQLATIYHNYKLNYIRAIYHYDRYLELRPDAEKTQFINEQKLKVAQALANTLINNSPEVKKVVQDRNQLIQQNQKLKRQLAAALNGQSPTTAKASAANQKTVTQTVPKTAQSSTASHRIYHVEAGDNLTKIAQKFYGTGEWEPIFEANRDTLRSPGDLKVGQTIVIPNTGN